LDRAALFVERSVAPASTVPVCVPLKVLGTLSVVPAGMVKVCASADNGTTNDKPTSIDIRLTPSRHTDIPIIPQQESNL
jgi:hypothetical protein